MTTSDLSISVRLLLTENYSRRTLCLVNILCLLNQLHPTRIWFGVNPLKKFFETSNTCSYEFYDLISQYYQAYPSLKNELIYKGRHIVGQGYFWDLKHLFGLSLATIQKIIEHRKYPVALYTSIEQLSQALSEQEPGTRLVGIVAATVFKTNPSDPDVNVFTICNYKETSKNSLYVYCSDCTSLDMSLVKKAYCLASPTGQKELQVYTAGAFRGFREKLYYAFALRDVFFLTKTHQQRPALSNKNFSRDSETLDFELPNAFNNSIVNFQKQLLCDVVEMHIPKPKHAQIIPLRQVSAYVMMAVLAIIFYQALKAYESSYKQFSPF